MALAEGVVFRVYVARGILREGAQAAVGVLAIDRMKAVILVDMSVELLLRTLLPLAGTSPKRDDNVPALLTQMCDARKSLESHKSPIERLRRLRDRVQHDGVIPSAEDARRAALEAESFAEAMALEVVGQPLVQFNPVGLIAEQEVRRRLEFAQDALEAKDYFTACKEAAIAFRQTGQWFSSKLSWRSDPSARITAILLRQIGHAARRSADRFPTAVGEDVRQFAREFASQLRSEAMTLGDLFAPLQRTVELAGFGILPHDLRNFEEIAPIVYGRPGQEYTVMTPEGWNPSAEAAAFCVDFAIRSALLLEGWLRTHPESAKLDG